MTPSFVKLVFEYDDINLVISGILINYFLWFPIKRRLLIQQVSKLSVKVIALYPNRRLMEWCVLALNITAIFCV